MSQETKFTPGPWDKIQHGERDSRVGRRTLIAVVYSEVFKDRETQEANACLIAAAPELYEALRKLTTLCGPHVGEGLRSEANAALAKARGDA